MRNIWTVVRRELSAYFYSPIGYIYLIAFLLFTNLISLYTIRGKSFFEFSYADMRDYFWVLGGVSAFLVAAITMRLWSEERKENTFEMLLTFPMKARELVLGKFFASLAFYGIGLLGTLTVPLMMVWLSQGGEGLAKGRGFFGLLDPGATAAGYLGALLVGSLFISFGLFISGLCRDQIVAFVVTAPSAFFAYLLGIDKVKTDMNGALSFLDPILGANVGLRLGDFIGIFTHYNNLTRGLLDGADIVFFLIWIAIFLVLNGWGIERRGRRGSGWVYSAAVAILILQDLLVVPLMLLVPLLGGAGSGGAAAAGRIALSIAVIAGLVVGGRVALPWVLQKVVATMCWIVRSLPSANLMRMVFLRSRRTSADAFSSPDVGSGTSP